MFFIKIVAFQRASASAFPKGSYASKQLTAFDGALYDLWFVLKHNVMFLAVVQQNKLDLFAVIALVCLFAQVLAEYLHIIKCVLLQFYNVFAGKKGKHVCS